MDISCDLELGSYAPSPPPPPLTLTVMAFNLARGVAAQAQIQAFRQGRLPRPDLMLVSEADRGCSRSGYRHVLRDYAQALEMDYVFGVEFLELPRAGEPRLGRRATLRAEADLGGRTLGVYSVHFESHPLDGAYRDAQAAEVAADAAARTYPVVVGGDFNGHAYGADLRLGTGFDSVTRALREAGFVDAHRGLDPARRGTHGPLVVDLILGRGGTLGRETFQAPALCEGDGAIVTHMREPMRTVQMTLDADLVAAVDKEARRAGTSRSAFAREALRAALRRAHERALEQKHREGYRRKPVRRGEFSDWEAEQVWVD